MNVKLLQAGTLANQSIQVRRRSPAAIEPRQIPVHVISQDDNKVGFGGRADRRDHRQREQQEADD
jgi:hypothetical protein